MSPEQNVYLKVIQICYIGINIYNASQFMEWSIFWNAYFISWYTIVWKYTEHL